MAKQKQKERKRKQKTETKQKNPNQVKILIKLIARQSMPYLHCVAQYDTDLNPCDLVGQSQTDCLS